MFSTIEREIAQVVAPDPGSDGIITERMPIVRITGNYLVEDKVIRLSSPKGTSLISAVPFTRGPHKQILFSFGSETRSVNHVLTLRAFETLIGVLDSALTIATHGDR